jgi:hypothetical protein
LQRTVELGNSVKNLSRRLGGSGRRSITGSEQPARELMNSLDRSEDRQRL